MFPEYTNPFVYLIKKYGLYILYGFLVICFFFLFKKWGVKPLLVVLAAFYCLLLFLAFWGQKFLIYYPDRSVQATPSEVNVPFQEEQLKTPDGETLHAWFIPGDKGQPVVLFCHGNGSNISSPSHLKFLELIHSLGLSACIFDYRGFGRSSGSPDQEGTYIDAETVWDHLVQARGFREKDIVIWGKSLGGGIAAYLAAEHPSCRALVLESTFTSIPDVARGMFPFLPVGWLIKHEYPVVHHVSQVDSPVLVMHSRQDETVPYRLGRRVYAAAGEPKEFVTLRGGHVWGFLASREIYTQAIREQVLD